MLSRGGSYHCWKYSYPHHCQKQGQHHDLWEGRGGGEAAPAEGSIRTQTCLLSLGLPAIGSVRGLTGFPESLPPAPRSVQLSPEDGKHSAQLIHGQGQGQSTQDRLAGGVTEGGELVSERNLNPLGECV